MAVVRNIWRNRQKWTWMVQILSMERADARTSGHNYLAVVQLVMIYGSDTWILTPRIKRVLGRFHHSVYLRLTGRQPWKGREVGWFYPPLEYVMVEAGLTEVETYISRLQNTVTQYIATGAIMYLFLAAKHRPGPRVAI